MMLKLKDLRNDPIRRGKSKISIAQKGFVVAINLQIQNLAHNKSFCGNF